MERRKTPARQIGEVHLGARETKAFAGEQIAAAGRQFALGARRQPYLRRLVPKPGRLSQSCNNARNVVDLTLWLNQT